ncbi:HDOD domain-containing protein [Stieleria marina]
MLHRVEDKRRLEKVIEEHLKKAPELRPFPEAVTRLLSACRDTDSTSKDIESIIACDPSLSVKILRLANSPLFCPARDVHSIVHAVTLLGRSKIKSIALSAVAADMLLVGDVAKKQRQELWDHSVGCAAVASSLAKYVAGVQRDDVFLAGIFHDVGKLLFYDVVASEYDELTSDYLGRALIEEEQFLFGTTHESIGVTAANRWGLPDELLAAIGWHHRPEDNPFGHPHALIISVADDMARKWGIGSRPIPEIDLDEEVLQTIKVCEDDLAGIKNEAVEVLSQTLNLAVA